MSKPTKEQILEFLGTSQKNTIEIAEKFGIKYTEAAIMLMIIPEIRRIKTPICKPDEWCKK